MQGCLGRGGYGEVYRATMSRQGGVSTEVAVKVLSHDVDPTGDAVRRLKDEGRLLGALDHPVILKVYDLVLLDGRVALVTEFIEGQDLHHCVAGKGALPLRGLVETVGQVAEALHAAWTTPSPSASGPMRLVHRDVKPQNIRIGIHGQVKLLDFGIARATNVARESHTRTNILMGSWPYLAPERMGEDERGMPGPAIDVYSLGCVLYEGIAGERLMEGYRLLDLYRIVDQSGAFADLLTKRLQRLVGRAPEEVLALLTRLLSADAAARPPAEDVARRCEELAESLPGSGVRRWARSRQWPRLSEAAGPLTDSSLTEGTLALPRDPHLDFTVPIDASLGGRRSPPASLTLELDKAEVEPSLPDIGSIMIDAPNPKARARRADGGALLGLAATSAVGLFVIGLIGAGVAVWWAMSAGPLPPDTSEEEIPAEVDPAPAPAPAPDPAPVPAPAPAPDPAPAPAPVAEPEPAPSPVPEALPPPPPVVAPEPAPAPGPVISSARMEVEGDAVVELRSGFGGFRPGTPLPVGPYDVWADFGEGLVDTGLRTRAAPGGKVSVKCSAAAERCFVTPMR